MIKLVVKSSRMNLITIKSLDLLRIFVLCAISVWISGFYFAISKHSEVIRLVLVIVQLPFLYPKENKCFTLVKVISCVVFRLCHEMK